MNIYEKLLYIKEKMDSTDTAKFKENKIIIKKCVLEKEEYDTKPSGINSNNCNNTIAPLEKEFLLAYPNWENNYDNLKATDAVYSELLPGLYVAFKFLYQPKINSCALLSYNKQLGKFVKLYPCCCTDEIFWKAFNSHYLCHDENVITFEKRKPTRNLRVRSPTFKYDLLKNHFEDFTQINFERIIQSTGKKFLSFAKKYMEN